MELTHESIRKFAGAALFARGMAYYRDARVISVSWGRAGVTASVQGSRKRPYTVSAGMEYGQPVLGCSCSSHWGEACQHGVALLLYLCEHGGLEDKSLPGQTRRPVSGGKKEAGDGEAGLAEYLASSYELPRLRFSFSFPEGGVKSGVALPLTVMVSFRGASQKVSDIASLLGLRWRTALAGLPPGGMLSDAQRNFLTLVQGLTKGEKERRASCRLRLPPGHFVSLLERAADGAEVDIIDALSGRPVMVRPQPWLVLTVRLCRQQEGGLTVSAGLGDPLLPEVQVRGEDLLPGYPLWSFDRKTLICRKLHPQTDRKFLEYFLDQQRFLQKKDALSFLGGVLPALRSFAGIDADDSRISLMRLERGIPLFRYQVDVWRAGLAVDLAFEYAGLPVKGDEDFVEADGVLYRRDKEVERQAARQLVEDFGMFFDENTGRFHLASAEAVFDFLSFRSVELSSRGQVFFSAGVREMYRDGELLSARVTIRSTGIDWFSYDITLFHKDRRVDVPAELVQECLQSGRRFLRTRTGEFLALDREALSRVAQTLAGRIRDGGMMAAHVPGVMQELSAAGVVCETDETACQISEAFRAGAVIEEAVLPERLVGVLRNYQRHGVNWILFLRKFRLGGVLADEMGLGKTLQALTAIRCSMTGEEALPSLIVCPTTLVWNWEAEVRKFFPELSPLIVSGADRRAKLSAIEPASVVITSYALLRRDIDCYRNIRFNLLILDEAQNIKNRHTINARVVRRLQARQRLALTGTPLENGIADIWSLYDFLMPGFLGDYGYFRTAFESPVMQEHDRGKLELLSRRISPFVLRRMKQDVISEIPEKIEQVSFCELEPAQARVYADMADRARSSVLDAVKRRGFQQSRMLILTLILRLRQICCHPELAGFRFGHRTGISAKTDLFRETLAELLSAGHRVLVFSQFVGMLSILRDYLEKEKVSFEYMDGQSRNRAQRVQRFNEDRSLQVFLLSLKVGGLGLNLTSADTVILYEPWWNPAVEQQAIDRVHRIGQKNSVLAYRLIARGTVEEKIMELQKRKKSLLGSLVLSDEGVAKKMDWDDIRFLLDIK